jgi:hypothetical protein
LSEIYIFSKRGGGAESPLPWFSIPNRGIGLSNRTTALGIFLLAFAAFAWLAPQDPSNPQVVTRLALTLSIVESGRLDIDRFANRAVDKALFKGRCTIRTSCPASHFCSSRGSCCHK